MDWKIKRKRQSSRTEKSCWSIAMDNYKILHTL
jgi:hypothetical protein